MSLEDFTFGVSRLIELESEKWLKEHDNPFLNRELVHANPVDKEWAYHLAERITSYLSAALEGRRLH